MTRRYRKQPHKPPSAWMREQVARLCRAVLAESPKHPDAQYRLGVQEALEWSLGKNASFERRQRKARKDYKAAKGKA